MSEQPQQTVTSTTTDSRTSPSSWGEATKPQSSSPQPSQVQEAQKAAETLPQWANGLPEDIFKWSTNKGFADPSKDLHKMLTSAYNAEKMIGLDRAGRLTEMPNEKSTPEQIKAFYSKLGVPDKPEGYKFDDKVQSFDPQFASAVAKAMHENNIPEKAAKGLENAFNGYMQEAIANQQKEENASKAAQMQELFDSWGDTKDARISMVNSISKKLGVDGNLLMDSLASKMGYKQAFEVVSGMNMIANNRESPFVSTNERKPNIEDGMSKMQAAEELDRLKRDSAFNDRVRRSDTDALNTIRKLSMIASR